MSADAMSDAGLVTLLVGHVAHVRVLVAKEEMVRIAARRVIALVIDLHAVRDTAYEQAVCEPMRALECLAVVELDVPLVVGLHVPEWMLITRALPAARGGDSQLRLEDADVFRIGAARVISASAVEHFAISLPPG